MLKNTPEEFYHETVSKLEANATILADTLGQVPGLKVVKPSGAMYVMVSRIFLEALFLRIPMFS